MSISNIDPSDPVVQLEVLRERLKFGDEKIRQLEGEVTQLRSDLVRKETELKQIRDDRDELKIKLAVAESSLQYGQELLRLNDQQTKKKGDSARRRIISANLLYFLAAVLTGFGTSMLTSTPSNSLGWMMLVFASITYLIGAISISTERGEE